MRTGVLFCLWIMSGLWVFGYLYSVHDGSILITSGMYPAFSDISFGN